MNQPEETPYVAAIPQRASQFTKASELAEKQVPEREWLVRNWIPGRNVTLVYGDGGTGKSLLTLQLAHAVATGGPWMGKHVKHGDAVFISAEDDEDELHIRLADIARETGTSFLDMDRLTYRSLAGEDALLANLDHAKGLTATTLYAEVDAYLSKTQPALLVLDTLADLFPGNENDRAQARQFIGLMRKYSLQRNCAVVLLAHPSLSGLNSGTGGSGSTGWSNSVRARLYFERVTEKYDSGHINEPDVNARKLFQKKTNYGPAGLEISAEYANGIFIAKAEATPLDRKAASAKAERVFLKLARMYQEQHRPLNASSGSNYAPAQFSSHPDNEGVTKKGFKDAMNSLLSQGKIRNVKEGRSMRLVLG